MGKRSRRNYGFGKSAGYAVKRAIAAAYGGGRFATQAAHRSRWRHAWMFFSARGLVDTADLSHEDLKAYAATLQAEVTSGTMKVSYAQNLLSTVNVVLDCLGAPQRIRLSPRAWVGKRRLVREEAPDGEDLGAVQACVAELQASGLGRAGAVLMMTRTLGVRLREATLADLTTWKRQVHELRKVNVQEGTKGGRDAPRWVEASPLAREAIELALHVRPSGSRNLLNAGESLIRFYRDEIRKARTILKACGLGGFHEMRASYACDRYEQETGQPAPVRNGCIEDRAADRVARLTIAEELGHAREDIAAAYVGGRR